MGASYVLVSIVTISGLSSHGARPLAVPLLIYRMFFKYKQLFRPLLRLKVIDPSARGIQAHWPGAQIWSINPETRHRTDYYQYTSNSQK